MVPTGNSTTTLMALLFVGVAAFYLKSVAAAAITEGPVSLIALIGTNAQFHCAGTGNYLVWVVDGLQTEHPDILARGITTELVQSSGTVHSTLTVPATSVNNGTTVRCRVIAGLGGTPAVSDQANLTVVQGVSVGPVLNPRFSPTFDAIMWDPPSTVGVLSGLTYHLTVTNVNTDVVDINTTTADTSYPLGPLEFCVNYTASVTVLHTSTTIPEHKTARTPGSDYIVEDVTIWVIVSQYDTVRVNVSLQVKLPFDQFKPCKTQNLSIEIRFRWNNSVYTYFGQLIQGHDIAAVVNYSILMNKSLHLIALIGIGDQNLTILYFSTFAVQNCDVLTNHTSYILVECTFAINSTAPGFVLIQDEHSQYTINTTLQRHEGDVGKGSANITDLPAGEYRVTVYDEMEDYLHKTPAFTLSKPIHFESVSDLPTSVVSPSVASSSTAGSQSSLSFNVTPTLLLDHKFHFVLLVATIPTGVAFILILVIVFIVTGLYIKKYRDKADVSTPDNKSGKDNQQVDQERPDFCLQMSSLTISSDGSSTDRSPQNAPPILPANNKEEKSAHIGSSDDESTPTRSAAVRVDISTSQTAVSEVHESQDSHHHSALAGSEKSPVEAVHDPKWYLTSGKCKQQELVVEPPSVSLYMNACAQEHMYENVADALDEKGTDCQDTDNFSSYSLEEVGLALGKDTQKVVVGCDDGSKKTTRHVDNEVDKRKENTPPQATASDMENVNPVDSNECSKIATSSLATLSSSGYNSGENVPEEGKSPPLRKSVSLKDLDSSKTTAVTSERDSVLSSESIGYQ